jgi:hypothetical protein
MPGRAQAPKPAASCSSTPPTRAGRYVEDLLKNPPGPMSDDERKKVRERYNWEVVGPNPL